MVEQGGLYTTEVSCFEQQHVEPPQPVKRPQALKSRAACAERCESGTASAFFDLILEQASVIIGMYRYPNGY